MVSLAESRRRIVRVWIEATFIARIIAEEANHENAAAYFLECSLLHAARTGRRSPSAAAGHGPSCTESHHLRLGWASSRRPDSGNYAELLRACSIRRRLCRPSRRLSDLHDDEFRLHRHWNLSGRAWVLRQRGVCAVCEGKEREGSRYRFFRAGVHRGFRRGRSGARAPTRASSRLFRRCCKPHKPKG